MCVSVCVFECKTSSVAAGVKVAQAVNTTHSLILSHFLSPSFSLIWFLHCCNTTHLHLLLTPLFQSQAAPPTIRSSCPDSPRPPHQHIYRTTLFSSFPSTVCTGIRKVPKVWNLKCNSELNYSQCCSTTIR